MTNNNLHRLAELGLQCLADSHDINRNLSLIELNARENKNEAVLKCVSAIRISMNYLTRIKYQKEQEEVDISLSEASDKMQKYFKSSVKVDCKKDGIVKTTRGAVLQSLINLVDNALNFSMDQTCLITIDGKCITVSDNGKGVPDEIKEQIFDLYFTTKDISRIGCNTGGVGLWAVKQHMDNIGAAIAVENNTILPGANFKITFR